VIPPDKATRWANILADRPYAPGRETTDAVFALGQIARVSGDRTRDLDDATRTAVLARLVELGADDATLIPVRDYHEIETHQQSQALGDALPTGLRLLGSLVGT